MATRPSPHQINTAQKTRAGSRHRHRARQKLIATRTDAGRPHHAGSPVTVSARPGVGVGRRARAGPLYTDHSLRVLEAGTLVVTGDLTTKAAAVPRTARSLPSSPRMAPTVHRYVIGTRETVRRLVLVGEGIEIMSRLSLERKSPEDIAGGTAPRRASQGTAHGGPLRTNHNSRTPPTATPDENPRRTRPPLPGPPPRRRGSR